LTKFGELAGLTAGRSRRTCRASLKRYHDGRLCAAPIDPDARCRAALKRVGKRKVVNGRSADPGLSCRAALKRAGAEGAKPRSAVDPGDRLPGCIEAIEGVAADFQGVVSIPAFVPGRIERSDKITSVNRTTARPAPRAPGSPGLPTRTKQRVPPLLRP